MVAIRVADLIETTTTGTAFITKTQAVLNTPTTGAKYLVLWSALISNDGAAATLARLQNVTDVATQSAIERLFGAVAEYQPAFGMYLFTAPDATSRTFEVQFASGIAGQTAKIKECRLLIIEVPASTQSVTVDAESTHNTAFVNEVVATLTFTPATAGDYLILAMAEAGNTTASSNEADVDLRDATAGVTIGSAHNRHYHSTTERLAISQMVRATLGAVPQSYTLRCGSDFSNAVIRRARIVALRLDEFPALQYSESRVTANTTSTTFQTGQSLAFTPGAGDHLILGQQWLNTGSATDRAASRMSLAGTPTANSTERAVNSADDNAFFLAELATLAATPVTYSMQFAEVDFGTAVVDEGVLAVLQLNGGGPPPPTSGSTNYGIGRGIAQGIMRGAR